MTASIFDLLNPSNQNSASTVNSTDTVTLDQNGTLVQGTVTQLSTGINNPTAQIANATNINAGALNGAEFATVSRGSGILQTTLTTIANWILNIFGGFTNPNTGGTTRTIGSKLRDFSSPLDFGAIGNGSSNPASNTFSSLAALQAVYPFATSLTQEMDYLAWQAALNAGGGIYTPQLHYIMCNSNVASQTPLTVVSGQSWVEAQGAIWDFSAMVAQTTTVSYVPNYNFATSAGWANSSIWTPTQITLTTFGGGTATYTDPNIYNSFSGAVSSAGVLTVTGFSGTTALAVGQTLYGTGVPTGVTITSLGTGTGGNGTYNLAGWGGTTVAAEAMNTSGGHFCQFGTQVTLTPGKYKAILTATATLGASYVLGNPTPAYGQIAFFQNSPGYGPNFTGNTVSLTGMSGVLTGTVSQTIELDFIVTTNTTSWLTFTGGGYVNFSISSFNISPWLPNSAVIATRDGTVEHYPIHEPVEGIEIIGPGSTVGVNGILFKSFTNLDGNILRFDRSAIHGFGTGINFQDGAYLAQLSGLEIYSNGTGINYTTGINSGENFRFYGGGIYNNTIGLSNVGGAEFTFYGTAIDYNTQAIVNNAGRVELYGVHAEMNVPSTAGYPLFQCVNSGRISMFGGMFLGAGATSSAAEPPINLASAMCSFLFEGTEVYNLSSIAGIAASGPGMLRFSNWRNKGNANIGPTLLSNSLAMDVLAGSGTFEPATSTILYGADTSGINLAGGMYTSSALSQWNSNYYTLAVSTSYAQSGISSLSVSRLVGSGQNGQLVFIVPVQPGHDMLGQINFLFPNNVGTGTATLYYRLFWVKVLAYDSFNRPIFDTQTMFKGETDITVPLAGSTTWINRGINTLYTTDSSVISGDVSPGAPQWASHLAIVMDQQNLPVITYYIDNFIVNQI